MAQPHSRHVVIIGAGFGGLTTARELGKSDYRLTVIDQNNHHLFQPLLYQVATAGLSPAEIAIPIRSILNKQENTEVLMDEVIGVDRSKKMVLTKTRTLLFDELVIATGSRHSYFGHENWSPYAPGLKNIEDAVSIRKKILMAFEAAEMEPSPEIQKALLTFVLIGAGPTGVEMAGAIAELAHWALACDFRHVNPQLTRVVLIEAAPRILGAFPEDLAKRAQKSLERLCVEVHTSATVETIDPEGIVAAGKRIPAKTVIWTAGVQASPAGRWLGAEMDRAGRVKVLGDLTVPDYPNIFVIGDTASYIQNGKPLPGLAAVAKQQGRYVAETLLARQQQRPAPPAFHYVDKGNLATIGRSAAIAQIRSVHFGGFSAWLIWAMVHIYYMVGFQNRMLILIQWAWAYLTYQRGARLITR